MRQIGTLADPSEAQRFTAYLVTQGISAMAEPENGAWVIWVHDENELGRAREALTEFQAAPGHQRYRDAGLLAERLQREQQKRRELAQKNVVTMRDNWSQTARRRCPLVWVLIGLSTLVSLSTDFGDQIEPVQRYLNFCRVQDEGGGRFRYPTDGFAQLKQGQLWRAVTPIFLHFGLTHLIFNMLALYYLGSQVEDRRGTIQFGLMVLVLAVVSNIAQYAIERSPLFGGMSGVCYGLFGYVWMKSLYDPLSGMYISQTNVALLLGCFLLFVVAEFEPFKQVLGQFIPRVANTAHGAGLLLGVAMGYGPIWWRKQQRRAKSLTPEEPDASEDGR
jgi:GlpG protein